MKTFSFVLASLIVVVFLLFPSGSFAQQTNCTDLGQSQHPRIAAGLYYVSHLDNKLYHLSSRGAEPRLVSGADWSGTYSVTSLRNWLYIVQDGKLHRVNPETGEWFPKNFDDGVCRWYAGWSGPIWVEQGDLYAVQPDAATLTLQLLRLNFEDRRSTVIRDYTLSVPSIVPSLSTEVHK